jgi:hypothetical protein
VKTLFSCDKSIRFGVGWDTIHGLWREKSSTTLRCLLLLVIFMGLTSCAYTNSKGSLMLGGKGAAKGGGSGDGSWAMVWNGEKSFRDAATVVGAVAAGYFANAATQAAETTNQVVARETTKRAAAVETTKRVGITTHGAAYGTAVGAEVPGVVAPDPPVAPKL